MKKILILFLILFTFSSYSQNVNKKLENFLQAYYEAKEIPSISAGIANKDRILWTKSVGFADLENFVPASPKSVYRIASISKPITAVAIMQLVEQGKVSLDVDIRRYLTYFPVKKWAFTIRQLLNHTSGIRTYREGEFETTQYYFNARNALKTIMDDSLLHEPGTKYLYSTLSYNILSAIIEEVTKMSFADYLKKNVFEPAGMTSTFCEYQMDIVYNRSRGYVKGNDRNFRNAALADLSIKFPGGGIISTIEDLLKFSMAMLNNKLITKKSYEELTKPAQLKNGRTIDNYGLGWVIGKDSKGRKTFSHSGGGTGFTSMLIIYPEDNLASVHLINSRDRHIENPASSIALIYFNEDIPLPKKSIADHVIDYFFIHSIDSSLALVKYHHKEDTSKFIITKEEYRLLGNDLLNGNRIKAAIEVFNFITHEYPDYADGFLGLAESYNKDNNKGLALKNYKRVLVLDKNNKRAQEMVKRLEGS